MKIGFDLIGIYLNVGGGGRRASSEMDAVD